VSRLDPAVGGPARRSALGSPVAEPVARLRSRLRELAPVVVAFSGGADSAFLAWMARHELGRTGAASVTAVSPSLATDEHAECASLADEWDLDWVEVFTDELHDPGYRANDPDRCFHCKTALMVAVAPVAAERDATVVLGVNLDDLDDHRPGQRAAAGGGAAFPLVDAGMTKADVRAASRALGLRTWDKPAAACLASRVPYGTPVTFRVLSSVDKAEAALRRLGFAALRVRHYGDTARIEVPLADLDRLVAQRAAVVGAVHAAGYRYVTVDLEGLRSGNLNAAFGLDAGGGVRPRRVDPAPP
jgi:uncharacterized protein